MKSELSTDLILEKLCDNGFVELPESYPKHLKPKSSCKYCYGRGYDGTNLSGDFLLCRCIRKKIEKEDCEFSLQYVLEHAPEEDAEIEHS